MWKRALLVYGFACGSGPGFPIDAAIDAPPPGGTFSVDWAVTDTTGNAISCAQIGGISMTVDLHNRAEEGGIDEVFACSSLTGSSDPILPGTYDINFQLVGQNSTDLADGMSQMGVEITSGGNTRLTSLAFAVQDTGSLAMSINSLRGGGNCGSGATGGNIDAMTIELDDGSGTCVPATFDIEPEGSSYTVDCTTPAVTTCIEHDQTLTATNVLSGPYQIHITGDEGSGLDCWANNDSFVVPPLGSAVTEDLTLAFGSATPGCL